MAPAGDSARPAGSEPTGSGVPAVGALPFSPVILTTVASARLATNAVSSFGCHTTDDGSPPVAISAIRVSVVVSKRDTLSFSGLTINTRVSSLLIAIVPDFDARLLTAAGGGASGCSGASMSAPSPPSSLLHAG